MPFLMLSDPESDDLVNVMAIAHATFEPSAAVGGKGPGPTKVPRLTIRFLAPGPGGAETREFRGATAITHWAAIQGAAGV